MILGTRMFILRFIFLLIIATNSWGRGGGGCFEEGTLVTTPSGNLRIETLKVGDHVYSRDNDREKESRVVSIVKVKPDHFVAIKLNHGEIHVTDEHLIATDVGVYKRAASIKPHQTVIIRKNHHWVSEPVVSISRIPTSSPAYNLLVDNGSTFLANQVLVHNKGCFLPETPILRADGTSVMISHIVSGEKVEAYEPDGRLVITAVHAVIKHDVTSYYEVVTNKIQLNVTGEHPFYVGNGTFKTVEVLRVGDRIYGYDGTRLREQTITSIKHIHAFSSVYNLQTDEPHTYFAAGIAVHNKGGGGFGGSRGGSGRSCAKDDTLCIVLNWLLPILFITYLIYNKLYGEKEDLDYLNSRANIERKSDKTMKLLLFISKQDQRMLPYQLKARASEVFLLLQQCWVKRDYTEMKSMMMPDLYQQHCRQIQGMIKNHEINLLKGICIKNVDLVNVRYTEKAYQREFTALITATASDYYIDDRNENFLRGSKYVETFQEFWTFELDSEVWKLRDIEQSRESDYLKEENFVEMMTDLQISKIYGDDVGNLGSSGPWLPKRVAQKENKVDRMLNFLNISNKMWDRQKILVRVRSVFTQVHMAMEAGLLDQDTKNALFPDVIQKMQATLETWGANGNTIEYRNFCVRKVEIILVKSFNDKSKNEFTARISAHAQIIHRRNGLLLQGDDDVTLFIELWDFGVLDNEWKLKSATPEAEADILSAENIEEGSSPNLVKWYYTKKRAM